MSDFRFVPAACFGEESFWDAGLELLPASLADDLVPTILLRGHSDSNVTTRFKSKNRLSLMKAGTLESEPQILLRLITSQFQERAPSVVILGVQPWHAKYKCIEAFNIPYFSMTISYSYSEAAMLMSKHCCTLTTSSNHWLKRY